MLHCLPLGIADSPSAATKTAMRHGGGRGPTGTRAPAACRDRRWAALGGPSEPVRLPLPG